MAQPALLKGMEKVEFFEVSATTPFWVAIADSDIDYSASTTITDYISKYAQLSIENYNAELPEVFADYFVDTDTDMTTFSTEQGHKVRISPGAAAAITAGSKLLFIAYSMPLLGADKRYVIYGQCYFGGENVMSLSSDVSTVPMNFYPIPNGSGSAMSIATALFDATMVDTGDITGSIADKQSSNYEIVALPSS